MIIDLITGLTYTTSNEVPNNNVYWDDTIIDQQQTNECKAFCLNTLGELISTRNADNFTNESGVDDVSGLTNIRPKTRGWNVVLANNTLEYLATYVHNTVVTKSSFYSVKNFVLTINII